MPTRKRCLEDGDKENVNDNASPKRQRTDKEKKRFKSAMDRLDIEVQERCDEMQEYFDILISSVSNKCSTQLRKLPKKIRDMSMSQFVKEFSGNVEGVLAEPAMTAKKALDHFMKTTYTPRVQGRVTRASVRKLKQTEDTAQSVEVAATPVVTRTVRRSKAKQSVRASARKNHSKFATPSTTRSKTLPNPTTGTAARVTRAITRKSHTGVIDSNDSSDVSSKIDQVGSRLDDFLDKLMA